MAIMEKHFSVMAIDISCIFILCVIILRDDKIIHGEHLI